MSHPNGFLDKDPDELESFLFAHARREVAPETARSRALLSVASTAVGVGLLSGVAASGARPALGKVTTWLATKWLLVGLGSGFVTLAAMQGVVQLTAPSPMEPAKNAQNSSVGAQARSSQRRSTAPSEPAPSAAASVLEPVLAPVPAPALSGARVSSGPVIPEATTDRATPSGRASVSASASASLTASELTRELALLDQARAALDAHSGARARQALDDYAQAFPQGSLRAEAQALRVQAVGFDDPARALRLAQAFLVSYPGNPLATRVRALVEGYRANVRNP